MPKIVVTGIPELDRALRRLGAKAANKVVRKALRAGAKDFAAAARSEAPVGETHRLVESIKVRAGRRSRKAISVNVVIGKDSFPGESYLYPAGVQLGEPGEGRPPDPYMTRAFDGREAPVKRRLESDIARGITREAGK